MSRFYTLDEEFGEWAFGKVWKAFLVLEADHLNLMDAWNARNSYLYRLSPDGKIKTDLKIMTQLWRKHGQKNAQGHAKDKKSGKRPKKRKEKGGSTNAKVRGKKERKTR